MTPKILTYEAKCRKCGETDFYDWDYTFPLFESQAPDALERAKANVLKYSPFNLICKNCKADTIHDLISFL